MPVCGGPNHKRSFTTFAQWQHTREARTERRRLIAGTRSASATGASPALHVTLNGNAAAASRNQRGAHGQAQAGRRQLWHGKLAGADIKAHRQATLCHLTALYYADGIDSSED